MEFARSDIRNIAFEAINDRFSKGKYLGVEVTIDMTNGYINGPHLAGQVTSKNGQPKRFANWKETASCKELIAYMTSGNPELAPIIDVTDAPNGLRGAYIHPRLVSHVAQWASPIFADKVAVIVNDYAINEMLMEKNQFISSLQETIVRIERQNEELLGYARKTDEELLHTRNELDHITSELDYVATESNETNKRLDVIQEKLDIAVELRVPRDPVNGRNQVVAIYQKPGTNECKVIRCQYRSWKPSKARCTDGGFTTQIYFKEDPNAINIWNRVKSSLPADIGRAHSGYFITLRQDPANLVTFIEGVVGEKKII